jgi:BASS family bile acid:Na+ symporter
MNIVATIIEAALKLSLALTVLAVSLHARPRDITFLGRHRGLLIRSFVSMNVVMPLAALWMAIVFDLLPPVKLALITLALSPVPPFIPGKAIKAGGHSAYMISLLVTMSILSLLVIPLSMVSIGKLFGLDVHVSPSAIARIVGMGILLPVAIGVAIGWYAPDLAVRLAKPVSIVAMVLLAVDLVPVLIKAWPAMYSLLDDGTVLAIVAMTIVGLGVGHLFGGPDRQDRVVLALSSASRHPAVAVAIALSVYPGEKLVAPAVLVDLIVVALVSVPYLKLLERARRSRKRSGTGQPPHEHAATALSRRA